MSPSTKQLNRRTLLQLSSFAPVRFVLGALGAGVSWIATSAPAAAVTGVAFKGMALPGSDADGAAILSKAGVEVSYAGADTQTFNLTYNTLYQTGDVLTRPDGGTVVAGGYYYPDGLTPMMDTSGANPSQYVSDCPDGQSLIVLSNPSVPGIQGNTLFLVTQFEYKSRDRSGKAMYGQLPSPIGVATLEQDINTGALRVTRYYNVPTKNVHGLWTTCAASQSPWNTHLSSEEYEPDAWSIDKGIAGRALAQFRRFSLQTFGSTTAARPYHYGHVPEVTVQPDGTASIKKHYCLGRISREKVEVMPDKKTVIQGDDITSGGLFLFVADVPGNLSAGNLYVARLTQTNASGAADGGTFDMNWIRLGHASSAEIEALANSLRAHDILDVMSDDPLDASYTPINHGNQMQWVRFKPGMEKAAAFLETRRYAAFKGGTMELTKFEGVTVDALKKKAYLAMSSIRDTMTKNGFVGDAVQLKKINAGAIYEVILGTDVIMDSDWVPKTMSVPAALLGQDIPRDASGNTADVNRVANPDNLSFSQKMDTLFIGEDSGMHLNNAVWAYNVNSKALARILTVPAGAECTGLQAKDDVNGFSYVLSNFQHPGDWKFALPAQAGLAAAVKAKWGALKNAKATVGYIGGIPKLE